MFQTLIDCDTLLAHLGHPDWVIFDCRFDLTDEDAKERDYCKGHLPGAIYANLARDLSGPVIPGKSGRHPLPDPDTLHRRFCNWGIGPRVQVVAYDSGPGSFAARLWWSLRWLGHDRVAVLEGGWKAWKSQNLPLSTEVPKPVPWRFPLQLQEGWVVHAETVLQESANPKSGSLMDAGRIASVGKTKRSIRSRDTFRAHGRCRRFPMWGRTGIFWMRRICGRNSSESWRGALRTAHQLLRVRSHGLSQPAGDETRRTGSRAALSGFVERVGHRSQTTGCHWSGLGDFFE